VWIYDEKSKKLSRFQGSEAIIVNDRGPVIGIDDVARRQDGSFYLLNKRTNPIGDSVLHWVPGSQNAIVVAGGNGHGPEMNQFNEAAAIAIDKLGRIYICDENNHRVMRWDPGAANGELVAGGNGRGRGIGQLFLPQDIIVDSMNRVFVADEVRVMRWDPGARVGVFVASSITIDSTQRHSDHISGIALTDAGDIVMAVPHRGCIQIWQSGAEQCDTFVPSRHHVRGSSPHLPKFIGGVSVGLDGVVYGTSTDVPEFTYWTQSGEPGRVIAAGRFSCGRSSLLLQWSPSIHRYFSLSDQALAKLLLLCLRSRLSHNCVLNIISYTLGIHVPSHLQRL